MKELSTIIVLGAVGVGAFVLVKRLKAAPAAAAALPATNSPEAAALYKKNDAALWSTIGGLLGGALSKVNSISVPGNGASGGYIGDEATYVPDAAAVNPAAVLGHFAYGLDYT